MLALLEDSRKFNFVAKNDSKTELDLIKNMLNNLRQNVHDDFSTAEIRGNGIWKVSPELCRNEEWSEVIRSLRVAGDGAHHLGFTNTYMEHYLDSYRMDLKEIKKVSEHFSDRLRELSRLEVEFNRSVLTFSPAVHEECKKDLRSVKFGRVPRMSKSAEESINKKCSSYGLILRDRRRDKLRRKKNFGKYCSSCGAVEVSSQNSVIRCCDCDGEIIVQGLCSSCDSFKGRLLPKEKRIDDKVKNKACSTCDFLRKKRICWDDKKVCNKCRKGKNKAQARAYVCEDRYNHPNAPKIANYVEESSCCSECDLVSSCDASASGCRLKSLSADSLVPLSDSDNAVVNVRSYPHDYDASSSISSSATEMRRDFSRRVGSGSISSILKVTQSTHEPLYRVEEETVSVDEDFNTPREYFSAEDLSATLADTCSEHSLESTLVDSRNGARDEDEERVVSDMSSDHNDKSTDSEEYVEATEQWDTEDIVEDVATHSEILLGDVVNQQPDLFEALSRVRKAEEVLNYVVEENVKLEREVSALENISQQNLKLSVALQEIIVDLATRLDFAECATVNSPSTVEEESDNSDEFEEALEDVPSSVKADSEVGLFYDTSTPNHRYLCPKCGIEASYKPLNKCCTCNGNLTKFPDGILNNELAFSLDNGSSASAQNLALDDFTFSSSKYRNREIEELSRAVYPVYVKMDFSRFPLSALESRLRQIAQEAASLKDNNDKISSLIDNLKKKTTAELNVVQIGKVGGNGEESETRIFGFDVSFYQFRRLVTETRKDMETALEVTDEEVCQSKRTFVEMKFEEVFKKEQQTALELEIFEEKLEIEGLIIKEMEDYFTCSSTSQAIDKIDDARVLPFGLSRRFTSEKFQTARRPSENDELTISIEVEVEKESNCCEKKAIRCEYKANLQRNTLKDQSYTRKSEYERVVPTITLFPMWTSSKLSRRRLNRERSMQEKKQITCSLSSGDLKKVQNVHSYGEFDTDEQYFLDVEKEDLVEIKAPNYFYGSSDEETESCAGDYGFEKRRKKFHSVAAVRMPVAMYPITEIRVAETPFAVLNSTRTTCRKKEFGRISQIELEELPQSGMVFMQTEAVSSLGVIECPTAEGSFEEFYEVKSQSAISDSSLQLCGRSTWGNCSLDSVAWKEATAKRRSSCLVKFIPINMGGSSVASISLLDETLPVLLTEDSQWIKEQSGETAATTSTHHGREEQELTRALSLIREIENDVVEVKLHNAIAILPQLESILREHLQEKIQVLKKKSSTVTTSSLDVFMSSLNFITEDSEISTADSKDVESDERLGKMLQLLTGLERAVKTEESSNECNNADARRIYDLLKALSSRIKGIDEEPKVSEMEKTLELASELDVAVRGYSSELQGVVSAPSQDTLAAKLISSASSKSFVSAGKLKTTKKKIFEVVATEAEEREARVERDFDRIARLERENVEVMRFLDTLLDKTLRRVGELDEIRGMVYSLGRGMKELVEALEEKAETKQIADRGPETSQTRAFKVGKTPTLPSIQEVSSDNRTSESSEEDKSQSTRETLSDMLVALDKLKIKAKEKKKRYKEIFGEETGIVAKPPPLPDRRNSSPGKGKVECGKSSITQFNRIGTNTYYMTWSKPEIADEDSTIMGYEIWVDGRVNQRVRNPERLKTVLYSVNSGTPGEKLRIKLFALTDGNRRLSLADLKYP